MEYDNQPLPDSPFHVHVFDPSKVKVRGKGIDQTGVNADDLVSFTIDTNKAGRAPADAVVVSIKVSRS